MNRLTLVLWLAAALVCRGQDAGRMDQIVQSYVNDHKFMGSVLVARGNQVLFSKSYGFANLEWQVPNTADTKFRLGSITKQFTAASILLLQERGKLSVDDAVKKYMTDAPAAWDKVTVFHLLTHTSGIPSFTGFPEYRKLEPFATTAEKEVLLARDKPLEFEPGSKWNYNNTGYVFLTYIIEKVSGMSYEKFVRENIFDPLGMKDSGYDSNSAIIAHRASGYTANNGQFENAGFIHMSVPQGAGSLYSTTGDLLKWEQGLFGGKVLKAASLEKMTTAYKNNYAFGLAVETVDGHKRIEHGGGIEGFNTDLAFYPEDKLTLIALSNVNGTAPNEIVKKLAELGHGGAVKLTGERKEITLDPKVLNRYVGAYRIDQGPTLLITMENNRLYSKLANQPAFPIFPESETMFFLKVVDAQLEFPKNEGEADASQVILHQNGRDITAKRLDDGTAKKVADEAAAAAQRFKDQKAVPGGEAVVKKLIEDTRAGKPDYASMSPALADAMRQQLPQQQKAIQDLGALTSLTFKGVGQAGADIYEAKFEKGSLEFRIVLSADGRLEGAFVRPL